MFHCVAKWFSTAVKCCICITIRFSFFHMIFNTSQAWLSLTVLCDVCWKLCVRIENSLWCKWLTFRQLLKNKLKAANNDVYIRKWLVKLWKWAENVWFDRAFGLSKTYSSSSLAQQPLSVKACLYPLVKWAWLSVTYCYHRRIVSPTYGGTVYSGLEPMTGMFLSRSSWRLYHQTGPKLRYLVHISKGAEYF